MDTIGCTNTNHAGYYEYNTFEIEIIKKKKRKRRKDIDDCVYEKRMGNMF